MVPSYHYSEARTSERRIRVTEADSTVQLYRRLSSGLKVNLKDFRAIRQLLSAGAGAVADVRESQGANLTPARLRLALRLLFRGFTGMGRMLQDEGRIAIFILAYPVYPCCFTPARLRLASRLLFRGFTGMGRMLQDGGRMAGLSLPILCILVDLPQLAYF